MKILFYLLTCVFLFQTSLLKASDPYWWNDYGMTKGIAPKDDSLATVGQLKHFINKTIDYLDDALKGGAGNNVKALRNQPWFTDSRNDKLSITLGQLKYVTIPIYDRLKEAHPSQYHSVYKFDASWDTRWMVDSSPFYSHEVMIKALKMPDNDLGAPIPLSPLVGDNSLDGNYSIGSHYPWTEGLLDDTNSSPVTLGQLKFTCSFETPASYDPNLGQITGSTYSGSKYVREYIPSNIQADESLPLYINLSGSSGKGQTSFKWCRQGQNRAYALHIESTKGDKQFLLQAEIIDSFIAKHQVDTKRIYFIGFSLGGSLLMDFLDKRPELVTVAWIVDPGNINISHTRHPLRGTLSDWTFSAATDEQKAFADKIAQENITVIMSMAHVRDNKAVMTFGQSVNYYHLFHSRGASVLYSVDPGWHTLNHTFANLDYRYHHYISKISK